MVHSRRGEGRGGQGWGDESTDHEPSRALHPPQGDTGVPPPHPPCSLCNLRPVSPSLGLKAYTLFTDLVKPRQGPLTSRSLGSLPYKTGSSPSPGTEESDRGEGTLQRLWSWPAGAAQVGVLQWPGRGLWQEGTQGSQRCGCSLLCTFTAAEEEERQALGAGRVWTSTPWRMSSVCPARGGEQEQKVWSFPSQAGHSRLCPHVPDAHCMQALCSGLSHAAAREAGI